MLPAILRAAMPAVSRSALPATQNAGLANVAGRSSWVNGLNAPSFGAGAAGGTGLVGGMLGLSLYPEQQLVDGYTGATAHNQQPVEEPAQQPTTIASPEETMRSFAGLNADNIPAPQYSQQLPTYNQQNGPVTAGLGLNAPLYQYKAPAQPQRQVQPQSQPQHRTSQGGDVYQGGLPPAGTLRPYNVTPTVSVQPTANGDTQFNLNQRTLQYTGDPDYVRLYQLKEARAREAAARAGQNYDQLLAQASRGY